MAYTLGNFIFDLYSRLGQSTTYKASGGSTTTVVKTGTGVGDSDLSGAIMVRSTTDGLEPVGEFSEVSAFNSSTGTFTFSPAMTAAIESGDRFAYASPLYPLEQMIEHANFGLKELGKIQLVDTTTLDTASNQTEYDAELVWKFNTPTRIDIQTNTSDANDNRWVTIYDWEFIPATAGTKGLIVFKNQPPDSRDVRVWYNDTHPELTSYDDVVSEMIQPELALASAKLVALEWHVARTQGSEPSDVQQLNKAQVDLEDRKRIWKVWKEERTPKITTIPRGNRNRIGEPNKVPL
jgi:hypothetical protein